MEKEVLGDDDNNLNPYLVRALYDFNEAQEGEIHFEKGDVILVTKQIDNNWLYGRNESQNKLVSNNVDDSNPYRRDCDTEGCFPKLYVELCALPGYSGLGEVCLSIASFITGIDGDLNFEKNEIIILERQIDENWCEGFSSNSCTKKGIFPLNFIKKLSIYNKVNKEAKSKTKIIARGVVLQNFAAQLSEEISLYEGDEVEIYEVIDDLFVYGACIFDLDNVGQFPMDYISVTEGEENLKFENKNSTIKSKFDWWKNPEVQLSLVEKYNKSTNQTTPTFLDQTAPLSRSDGYLDENGDDVGGGFDDENDTRINLEDSASFYDNNNVNGRSKSDDDAPNGDSHNNGYNDFDGAIQLNETINNKRGDSQKMNNIKHETSSETLILSQEFFKTVKEHSSNDFITVGVSESFTKEPDLNHNFRDAFLSNQDSYDTHDIDHTSEMCTNMNEDISYFNLKNPGDDSFYIACTSKASDERKNLRSAAEDDNEQLNANEKAHDYDNLIFNYEHLLHVTKQLDEQEPSTKVLKIKKQSSLPSIQTSRTENFWQKLPSPSDTQAKDKAETNNPTLKTVKEFNSPDITKVSESVNFSETVEVTYLTDEISINNDAPPTLNGKSKGLGSEKVIEKVDAEPKSFTNQDKELATKKSDKKLSSQNKTTKPPNSTGRLQKQTSLGSKQTTPPASKFDCPVSSSKTSSSNFKSPINKSPSPIRKAPSGPPPAPPPSIRSSTSTPQPSSPLPVTKTPRPSLTKPIHSLKNALDAKSISTKPPPPKKPANLSLRSSPLQTSSPSAQPIPAAKVPSTTQKLTTWYVAGSDSSAKDSSFNIESLPTVVTAAAAAVDVSPTRGKMKPAVPRKLSVQPDSVSSKHLPSSSLSSPSPRKNSTAEAANSSNEKQNVVLKCIKRPDTSSKNIAPDFHFSDSSQETNRHSKSSTLYNQQSLPTKPRKPCSDNVPQAYSLSMHTLDYREPFANVDDDERQQQLQQQMHPLSLIFKTNKINMNCRKTFTSKDFTQPGIMELIDVNINSDYTFSPFKISSAEPAVSSG
ncbi:hypothetical protein HELRODRAFT_175340 [Helobdella robusta]|uniref:SH3 domain-containing protein n=1 Tax=Helobdella robusta TaxID=6412 RepID=T1F961_HELRO|nr:hypothetical protein HELRODRAFT_175340 [Helobdella robusta]ESO00847.1 hypothetical protein HELRODRAFT_175340 [Helobdella robusta]